jgi:hypothetical protein
MGQDYFLTVFKPFQTITYYFVGLAVGMDGQNCRNWKGSGEIVFAVIRRKIRHTVSTGGKCPKSCLVADRVADCTAERRQRPPEASGRGLRGALAVDIPEGCLRGPSRGLQRAVDEMG